ncbi:sigma factor [Arthrobacter pigmenti]
MLDSEALDRVDVERRISEAVMDPRTAAVVRRVLGGVGLGQDTDDVISETAISAIKAATSFDPSLGSVQAWVSTIARRRALDHLRAAGSRGRLQGRLEDAAHGPDAALSITDEDFSGELIDQLAAAGHARAVLSLTASMVANPESFPRVAKLWMTYQGDVARASAALGISEDAMRDSRREVTRCAHVVDKALTARDSNTTATVRVLFDCLPTQGAEDGSWATVLAKAVVRAGGFHHTTAADMAAVSGYALNTCRQYLAESKWLLQVARTVISGGI